MADKKGGNGEVRDIKDNVKEFKNSQNPKDLSDLKKDAQEEIKKQEDLIKELQDEIDKLATKDIVVQMMMSLSSLAYKKMGIPIGTNDKFKNKEQARLAIDCFDSLLKAVGDEASAQERDNLQSSLTNLQMNFVKAFGV